MPPAVRDPDKGLLNKIAQLEQRLEVLERMPSGTNSVGVDKGRPCVIPTPSDASFTKAPPIGTAVYDVTNSKWWVRHAVGVWKGVVVT